MDDFITIIQSLTNRIDQLERLVSIKDVILPTSGSFSLPNYTVDPGSPVEGQIWRNTTSNQIKVYNNGVIRVINTTP